MSNLEAVALDTTLETLGATLATLHITLGTLKLGLYVLLGLSICLPLLVGISYACLYHTLKITRRLGK